MHRLPNGIGNEHALGWCSLTRNLGKLAMKVNLGLQHFPALMEPISLAILSHWLSSIWLNFAVNEMIA